MENMDLVKLTDMHQLQVEALINFVGLAIDIASRSGDHQVLNEVVDEADELVKLFGGLGVDIEPQPLR